MTSTRGDVHSTGPSPSYAQYARGPDDCQGNSLVSFKHHKRPATILVFENCIEYHPSTIGKLPSSYKPEHRGSIKEFSKRSRFRLFTILAKLRNLSQVRPMFVTLTYHWGFCDSYKKYKTDLHTFLTALRRYNENIQYIWRLEFQQRGAPHYHFILFSDTIQSHADMLKLEVFISSTWHSIADPTSIAHEKYGCSVKRIHDYSGACRYLSKYVAKVHPGVISPIGTKHWGCSHNLPFEIKEMYEISDSKVHSLCVHIRRWMLQSGSITEHSANFITDEKPFVLFIRPEVFDQLIIEWNPGLFRSNEVITPR
jgi:hypothetical protein